MALINQIHNAVKNGYLDQPFTVRSMKAWVLQNKIVKDDGKPYAKKSLESLLSNSNLKN